MSFIFRRPRPPAPPVLPPPPLPITPVTPVTPVAPEETEVRERLARMKGRRKTILTSPLGLKEAPVIAKPRLLGE